eukprot:Filipodium_phascolosomae@DN1851_c0_g1_i1.p1
MAAVSMVNPHADVLRRSAALAVNCNAAKGLQEVFSSNLGPRGTMKMLVSGGGAVKVTKDGNVLLHEMQIQHPTASMIARVATAQDDITGDGTTSTVLLIGEIMKLAEKYLIEGVHPRALCDGIDWARDAATKFLETFKVPIVNPTRELLLTVVQNNLKTKVDAKLALQMAAIIVDAVQMIAPPGSEGLLDLHMIEIMAMKKELATTTRLVRGLVLDHGARHPDMPKKLKNCYILTLNVSLEYEKSEVNSGFFYSSAEQREKLVMSERAFTDKKVQKIIDFKRDVCTEENKKTFVVINQKGIDPPSLDMFAREGIIGLRRAKRRNMERLTLACGGNAVNSVDDLTLADLGEAGLVYEETLGDDKYTFVEELKNPKSCTIFIKGPNDHTISQLKDAVRDGTRTVKNILEDKCLIPGAGSFEAATYEHLMSHKTEVEGKAQLGVQVFAEALLVTLKCLAKNSGLDAQDCLINVATKTKTSKNGDPVGLDLVTGEPMDPRVDGIWDNYCVKKQMLTLAPALTEQLLLVDEVIKAGKQMNKQE